MFLNVLNPLMVKGTVTAVISAIKGFKKGEGSVSADYADLRKPDPSSVYIFRPRFTSPDGSGNPFLAAVEIVYPKGFQKGLQRTAGRNPTYMLLLLRSKVSKY